MRLPADSQLSTEQKEIIAAPNEGTMLVVGPPGSGKTVVAVIRERALRKRRREVTSLVHNKVLTHFTGNEATFLSWIESWWRRVTHAAFPKQIHTLETGATQPEWEFAKASELATGDRRTAIRDRGHWGHLILDEAQDFPKAAHELLFRVQYVTFHGVPASEQPSLCILADENQRITAGNSTIAEIKEAHAFLTPREMYSLTKNYRNSRPIAEFAAHFYVGLPTGIPELPRRAGDKPRVVVADLDGAVRQIELYARNHPAEELGVLVQGDATRKRLYNKLKHRLGVAVVQTYSGRGGVESESGELEFDTPGKVTILCFASAKGLEFDAVFLPELQSLKLDGVGPDVVRMNLYVMCSRARTQLKLFIDDESGHHPIWSLLPPQALWERE